MDCRQVESSNAAELNKLDELYADSDSSDNEQQDQDDKSGKKVKAPFRIGLPINLLWNSPQHIRDIKDDKRVELCYR